MFLRSAFIAKKLTLSLIRATLIDFVQCNARLLLVVVNNTFRGWSEIKGDQHLGPFKNLCSF